MANMANFGHLAALEVVLWDFLFQIMYNFSKIEKFVIFLMNTRKGGSFDRPVLDNGSKFFDSVKKSEPLYAVFNI